MSEVYQLQGDWIFITPIGNPVLTDAVNNEFHINRVLFVHRDKLPRIRKRLGINTPLSRIKSEFHQSDFFASADTFAVVRQKGTPAEIKSICYRLVRDELAILAVSQLGYRKRRNTGFLGILGEHAVTSAHHLFLNKENAAKTSQNWLTRDPTPLRLDERWRAFQRQLFFTQLLRVLSTESLVSRTWRDDLRRAAILIGQSINSNDLAMSFLWNMIALELLLTRQDDKYSDALPRRVEAFLGWTGFWTTENYEKRIKDLYSKRSAFVHNGMRDSISKQDLLFSDDLLLNVLVNITQFNQLFKSKQDIITFSQKVEAEHLLGLKSTVRPKKFMFVSRTYTQKDLDEI